MSDKIAFCVVRWASGVGRGAWGVRLHGRGGLTKLKPGVIVWALFRFPISPHGCSYKYLLNPICSHPGRLVTKGVVMGKVYFRMNREQSKEFSRFCFEIAKLTFAGVILSQAITPKIKWEMLSIGALFCIMCCVVGLVLLNERGE